MNNADFKLTIVNTRPSEQAAGLNKKLQALGCKTLLFPTLEIIPISTAPITYDQFDFIIFVSANAVRYGTKENTLPDIPVIAIGPATATALQQHALKDPIIPKRFNSEGILALDKLQNINKKSVLIFCGSNSRPLLKDTLIKRGAIVTLAECYRRQQPSVPQPLIAELLKRPIDLIISTSLESLNNLHNMLGKTAEQNLIDIPLIAISEAMKQRAKNLQFKTIYLAENATDDAIIKTIKQLHTRKM